MVGFFGTVPFGPPWLELAEAGIVMLTMLAGVLAFLYDEYIEQ